MKTIRRFLIAFCLGLPISVAILYLIPFLPESVMVNLFVLLIFYIFAAALIGASCGCLVVALLLWLVQKIKT